MTIRRRVVFAAAAVGLFVAGVGAWGCLGGAAKAPAVRGPVAYDGAVAAAGAESGPDAHATAERLVIKTLSLGVHTKDPAAQAAATKAMATELGGFVLSATDSGDDRATLVLRVPAERLDEARGRLAALGDVYDEVAGGTDVTEASRDLHIRLDNARKTRESYVALLARAASVEETLKVEKELERVTVEIETMEAQLVELDTGVRLATISVELSRKVRPGPLGWVFYGGYTAIKWLFVWE